MPDQEEMHGLNPMAMHYTSHIQDFHNSIDFNGHQHDFHHLAFNCQKPHFLIMMILFRKIKDQIPNFFHLLSQLKCAFATALVQPSTIRL